MIAWFSFGRSKEGKELPKERGNSPEEITMLPFIQLLDPQHPNILFVLLESLEEGFSQDEVIAATAFGVRVSQ